MQAPLTDPIIEMLLRRIDAIERTMVTYRQGVVTDPDNLAVALGGSTVPYTDVRSIKTAEPFAVNDPVGVLLTGGNSLLAMGVIGSTTAAEAGTGSVAIFPADVPSSHLLMDGSTFDGVLHAALAAYLGGTTLPDWSGLVLVGSGGDYGVGDTGGEAEVTLTIDQSPKHRHTMPRTVEMNPGGPVLGYTPISNDNVPYDNTLQTDFSLTDESGADVGSDQPHENRQPFVVVNFAIKT